MQITLDVTPRQQQQIINLLVADPTGWTASFGEGTPDAYNVYDGATAGGSFQDNVTLGAPEVAPLAPTAVPTAAEAVQNGVPVPAPAAAGSPEEVRAAILAASQRLERANPSNSNATAFVVNALDEVCGCKKVGDIPADKYAAVIEKLATLGV